MANRWFRATVFVLGLVAVPISDVFADVLHLKNGETMKGEIVSETSEAYEVKVGIGVVRVAKADVSKVDRAPKEASEFETRKASLKPKDVAARWDLAKWATEQGLMKEADGLYREIVRIDPNHAEARAVLGYRLVDGKWMTDRDVEIATAKKESAKGASASESKDGKVLYRGRWVTPEEKSNLESGRVQHEGRWVTEEEKANLEKGMILHEGKWISKEEMANVEKGMKFVDGKWVSQDDADQLRSNWERAWELTSDHFALRTNATEAKAKSFLDSLEASYNEMKKLCDDKAPPADLRLQVWVLASKSEYNQMAGGADEHSTQLASFWIEEGDNVVGVTTSGDDEWKVPLNLYHIAAHLYERAVFHPDTPRWFQEGVASNVERWFNEKSAAWSKENLRRFATQDVATLVESFSTVDSTAVLQAGMLVTLLRTDPKYKDVWKALIDAATNKEAKDVERVFFKTLRKAKTLDADLKTYLET
jgi:hypothetical protein